MPRLGVSLGIATMVQQVSRLVRDVWASISDNWENELRKWEDIVQEIYHGNFNRQNNCGNLYKFT